ncbi:RING-H2 finger protein atl72, partial [Sarracenia purpurea var. burkii]
KISGYDEATEPPASSPFRHPNGGGAGGGERKQSEQFVRQRCKLRQQHGDNPGGTALRLDIQRFAFDDDPDRAAARLASTGLKKDALSQIPVAAYKSGLGIPATDCPICLGEFAVGEKVRILPKCNHGFHVKCIDIWLLSHSSCPTCRQLLSELPSSSNVEEGFDRV